MKRFILLALLPALLLSGCAGAGEIPAAVQTLPAETLSAAIEMLPTESEPIVMETVPIPTETHPRPEPADEDLVLVKDFIPDILVELKYASSDNFIGREVYAFSDVYLRYGTVKKLIAVQAVLAEQGLRLKIWDGFRPVSAQFTLWEACPDPTYVADPTVGFSSHSRGNTVDLTITDLQGVELTMPTGFDDFSSLADRNYGDCSGEQAANAMLLQTVMEENGFSGYFGEWWHYSDTVEYPVEQCFDPAVISLWYADCEEYITLRSEPERSAGETTRIPAGEEVTLLGYSGEFAMVDYQGLRGYVLSSYLSPPDFLLEPEEAVEPSRNRSVYRAVCESYISLREFPDVTAQVLARIPAGGTFFLLEWKDDFALVDYNGLSGYVLGSYIEPV